jgi:predicted DNA-binding transcriptional regulator AlpA
MPVDINGTRYLTATEVLQRIDVARQTLWRWRQEGRIPPGHRYRGRQVIFNPQEVAAIEAYANRIEPIDDRNSGQMSLFNGDRDKYGSDR